MERDYDGLIIDIDEASNLIDESTRRGKASWVTVCDPDITQYIIERLSRLYAEDGSSNT